MKAKESWCFWIECILHANDCKRNAAKVALTIEKLFRFKAKIKTMTTKIIETKGENHIMLQTAVLELKEPVFRAIGCKECNVRMYTI